MSGTVTGDKDWVRRYTAWQKAWPVSSFDSDSFRRDDYGNLINWNAYGDHTSPWGWEIDLQADSRLVGLRALHWRTSMRLADTPALRPN
jgi:hypothetical protein